MEKYKNKQTPIPYEGKGNYIFVSYSRKDKDIVYADLIEMNKIGVRFWYDDGIAAGKNWQDAVRNKIFSSRCVGVVFYLSKHVVYSAAIESEIAMVFSAGAECRKNNFAILIDYDKNNDSLRNILNAEIKNCVRADVIRRGDLISSIFAGEINYLHRSSEPKNFQNHFYKTIMRISDFGAIPLNAVLQLTPDLSDFEMIEDKDGIVISKYNGREKTVVLPDTIFEKK